MHNIVTIIVPCITISWDAISFVHPSGVSIVTIASQFIFLINSASSGNTMLFDSLDRHHLATVNHGISLHLLTGCMYPFLGFLLSSIIACSVTKLS